MLSLPVPPYQYVTSYYHGDDTLTHSILKIEAACELCGFLGFFHYIFLLDVTLRSRNPLVNAADNPALPPHPIHTPYWQGQSSKLFSLQFS